MSSVGHGLETYLQKKKRRTKKREKRKKGRTKKSRKWMLENVNVNN